MLAAEDSMFQYFYEHQNKEVTTKDLMDRFPNADYGNIFDTATLLFNKSLISSIKQDVWKLSDYGKEVYERKEKRESLERDQIDSVIRTNKMQRWSFWASLITALAALAVAIIGLIKKDDTNLSTSIVIQDTVLNSTHKDTLQLKIQVYQLGDTSLKDSTK